MMKRFSRMIALLLVAMTLTAVFAIPASADTKMRVTASWLRLRTGPGTDYDIISQYRNGSVVTVLTTKTSKHWYYVRTSRGQTGWMYKGYLDGKIDTVPASKDVSGTAVAKRNVNLRTGPGKKYDVIKLLPAGQSMTVIGRTGSWYKVTVGKQSGYVAGTFIKVKAK